jgi:hypothetical protein
MKYFVCPQIMNESISLFMFLLTMKDKSEETVKE